MRGVRQAEKLTVAVREEKIPRLSYICGRYRLLRMIGFPQVGVEHLLSAGLLAARRGLDRDKNGIDLLHQLWVLHFQHPTPLRFGIHAQQTQGARGQTRWLMYEQGVTSISMPLLTVLTFWITALFISFDLFAPLNGTTVASLFVSALSISGAIFLILEMYTPYGGLIEVSSAPLRAALAQFGK
jgi:hypothetical protein